MNMRKIGFLGLYNSFLLGGGAVPASPTGIADIDLEQPLLDSRVKYVGPPHVYRSETGEVLLSSENYWPVEFIAGVSVGRHEPEKEATNYSVDNAQLRTLTSGLASDDTGWTFSPSTSNVYSTPGELSSVFRTGHHPAGTMPYSGVYSETEKLWLVTPDLLPYDGNWQRVNMKFKSGVDFQPRVYLGRGSSSRYVYNRGSMAPAGDYITSFYRKGIYGNNGAGSIYDFESSGLQTEAGSIMTSPIPTFDKVSATRAASTVTITEKRAKSVTIIYSDGHENTVTSDDGVFTVPASTTDWSKRYITKFKFEAK